MYRLVGHTNPTITAQPRGPHGLRGFVMPTRPPQTCIPWLYVAITTPTPGQKERTDAHTASVLSSYPHEIIVQEKRGKTMTSSVYTTTDTAPNQSQQISRTWVWDGWTMRPTAWIPAPWDTGHEVDCPGHLLPTGMTTLPYFKWIECGCPNAVAQKPCDLLPAWSQVNSPDELAHPGDLWIGETIDVALTPSAFTTKG